MWLSRSESSSVIRNDAFLSVAWKILVWIVLWIVLSKSYVNLKRDSQNLTNINNLMDILYFEKTTTMVSVLSRTSCSFCFQGVFT